MDTQLQSAWCVVVLEGLHDVAATTNVVWLYSSACSSITAANMPDRVRILSNGKQLAIERACKNCHDSDRSTDLMVIQCNASNVHGYVFSDAYVNVLGECCRLSKLSSARHFAIVETYATSFHHRY